MLKPCTTAVGGKACLLVAWVLTIAATPAQLSELAEQRLTRAEAAQLDPLVQAQRLVEHQALGIGRAGRARKAIGAAP